MFSISSVASRQLLLVFKRSSFFVFAFLLLLFGEEEVSRSDGGDSAQFAVYWADTSVRPYGGVLSFRVL